MTHRARSVAYYILALGPLVLAAGMRIIYPEGVAYLWAFVAAMFAASIACTREDNDAEMCAMDSIAHVEFDVVENNEPTACARAAPAHRVRLSPNERRVLVVLAEDYDLDEKCLHFSTIMQDTGLARAAVRRACRALARKGCAEYVRGLRDDDGRVAGSGYRCTDAGSTMLVHTGVKARTC